MATSIINNDEYENPSTSFSEMNVSSASSANILRNRS